MFLLLLFFAPKKRRDWGFKGWYPPFLLLLSEKKSGGIPLIDTDCCAYGAQSIPAEPS